MSFLFQEKAVLAVDITKEALIDHWPDQESIQEKLERIAENDSRIKALDVLIPLEDQSGFEIYGSLSENARGQVVDYALNNIAWRDGSIVFTTDSEQHLSTERAALDDSGVPLRRQVVMETFEDRTGERLGIVSMELSLEEVSSLNDSLVLSSWVISIVLILALLFLITTNFSLYGYVLRFQKLQEVDEMKDEFISIASHELRAPITAIRGFNSMILDSINSKKKITKKEKQLKSFAESIDASSEKLGVLVEDMLNVSRIEQGRMDFDLKKIKPLKTVKEVIQQFSLQAEEKNLYLDMDKPDKEIKNKAIYVDPDKFKQVLVNLLSNAIKYTPKGGVRVKLQLSKKKDKLEVKVKDTGIGMDAKERESLFQKFYRVQTDKNRNIVGTGLGLWLTKQMTENMGGEIFVDSIKEVGSEFTLSFPVVKDKNKKK